MWLTCCCWWITGGRRRHRPRAASSSYRMNDTVPAAAVAAGRNRGTRGRGAKPRGLAEIAGEALPMRRARYSMQCTGPVRLPNRRQSVGTSRLVVTAAGIDTPPAHGSHRIGAGTTRERFYCRRSVRYGLKVGLRTKAATMATTPALQRRRVGAAACTTHSQAAGAWRRCRRLTTGASIRRRSADRPRRRSGRC
jgi:hypothetical protein